MPTAITLEDVNEEKDFANVESVVDVSYDEAGNRLWYSVGNRVRNEKWTEVTLAGIGVFKSENTDAASPTYELVRQDLVSKDATKLAEDYGFQMNKLRLVFISFCFVMTGCDYCFPKISVYNDASSPIDVYGDYFGHCRIGDNPQDSVWRETAKLNPGDSVEFFPLQWKYEVDNLKITVEFDGIEKKRFCFFL